MPLPRLPRISLSAIFRRKQEILDDPDVIGVLGTVPTGRGFHAFVAALRDKLPAGIPYPHVYYSALYLAGREISLTDLQTLAWRLAANTSLLRHGPVCPWAGQAVSEWVPVAVKGVARHTDRYHRPGATFSFFVLAGTPVGLVLTKFWTRRFVAMLASRTGFSKPWGQRPFRDPVEFYNLQLFALVEPRLSREAPEFESVAVSAAQLTENRNLLRLRQRPVGVFGCPRGFTLAIPCARCPAGEDCCPAATHRRTYEERFCEGCRRKSWFEPGELPDATCLTCRHRHTSIS